MKKIVLLSITILFFFLPFAIGSEVSTENANPAVNQEPALTRIYEVYGMDCPGCHGGLEKLVKKIPSVKSADANWKEKKLTVIIKPGAELNDEEIYDAIKRANFTIGKRVK